MDKIALIDDFLQNRYSLKEYPALEHQFKVWSAQRPLEGKKILDGTPVFANTLIKYKNLLAAGADLTVGYCDSIPFDPAIIEFLQQIGIKTVYQSTQVDFYDVIADCNAAYRNLRPRCGFVELTRSGAYHFAGSKSPVINVDDSRIKAIETCLGTGESFLRAMKYLDYDVTGKKIVVMGCGKVGRGVVFYAGRAGAEVVAVDDPQLVKKCVNGTLISRFEREQVKAALHSAWCVVSCTGQADALADAEYIELVLNGTQIMVNMGVEDEWGKAVPPERVLNNKEPLNFILEEPTLLRYIDPTMALHNHAVLELVQTEYRPGIRRISAVAHDDYWRIVEQYGIIAGELHVAGL
ncbi:MAG: hypothetical protein E7047_07950 [Lentisphaerae bacterium]|nr:hypothetical protein [Lentisphaerota bacterium]